MERTKEDILDDIKRNPDNHRHTFEELTICCTVNDAVVLSLVGAHSQWVDFGTNGGIKCDVMDGPCACGGWHHANEKQ